MDTPLLLPAELSEEVAGWVRRILQLAARSKSARPVCSQTIDGVVVDRVQSENIVQLGPQLVALKAWESLERTALPELLDLRVTKTTKDALSPFKLCAAC